MAVTLLVIIVVFAVYVASIAPRFGPGYWFGGLIFAGPGYTQWSEDIGIADLPFEEVYPLLGRYLQSNDIEVLDMFLSQREGIHWASTHCFIKVPDADSEKMWMLVENEPFAKLGRMRSRPLRQLKFLAEDDTQYPSFYWPTWLEPDLVARGKETRVIQRASHMIRRASFYFDALPDLEDLAIPLWFVMILVIVLVYIRRQKVRDSNR